MKKTLGSTYFLSAAIGAGSWRTGLSYNIPEIFETVDFVNLMTYHLHGGWESQTGINAPLFRSQLDPSNFNVDFSVQFALLFGVPKNKLIVGIPTFGSAFTLKDPSKNGVGAEATGAGSIYYSEICRRLNAGTLTAVWDDEQKVPYAFDGTYWVGYDNIQSVTAKANYINTNGLGGASFWSLNSDDFSGAYGQGTYPLIRTVFNILSENGLQPASSGVESN